MTLQKSYLQKLNFKFLIQDTNISQIIPWLQNTSMSKLSLITGFYKYLSLNKLQ